MCGGESSDIYTNAAIIFLEWSSYLYIYISVVYLN